MRNQQASPQGAKFGAIAPPKISKRCMKVYILNIFKKSLIWIFLCPTG